MVGDVRADIGADNTRLLAAYARGDGREMMQIYQAAGRVALDAGDIDAGCFLLTQAYVYGLELGAIEAEELRAILIQYGREE